MMHEYSKQLDAAFVKAAAIQQTLNDAGLPLAMADEVLAELFTALEELLVSEEELNAQKRALEVAHATALTERRRYYELFDFAPDGYLVTDVNGVIQEANQAAVSMIGIDSYYLVGKPLVTYIVLDQRQRFLEQLRNVRTQYMPLRWETRMKPRHLPEFDVAITLATATHEASPKSRQLRWLLRDISERKQLEAQEREQYFRLTFEQSGVGMAHIGPKGEFTRVNQKLCSLLGYTPDALKTKRFRDVIHPDDLAPSVEAHQQLLSGRLDQAALDTRYVREDGSVVWTIATLSAVYSAAGQFHYNVLVVEDITERKQIEMAEREQRLITETLHQIALVLTSSLKFSEVIDHILNTIGRVVPHDAAVLMLLENGVATIVRSRGYDTDLHSLSVPVAEVDVLRTMAKSLCPLQFSGWSGHDDFAGLPEIQRFQSFLGVPILAHDQVIGFLMLQSPQEFSVNHGRILQTFAAQAAVAIENARTYEQAQALAVIQERQRLARDLHDAVSQTLFSANVLAESLPRLWKRIPNNARQQIEQLQILTRGAMAEMRTLLLELRPEHLSSIDVATQLCLLVDGLRSRKRIEVQLDIEDGPYVPPKARVAFYRITQEALNNVVKHSRATRVDIAYRVTSEWVSLSIADNGVGFDVADTAPGFGLMNMRERAESVSAQLKIASTIGQGTCIAVQRNQLLEELE